MIKIIATLCSLAAPDQCRQVSITNSDWQDGLTMSSCHDVPKIVAWVLQNHPADRLAAWSCTIGEKPPGRDI
jgi:hypothetical protein